MQLKQLTIFLFFLVTVFCYSCNSDDESLTHVNENEDDISLSVERKGTAIELTWESINIDNFESYVIVRSSDSIPENLSPMDFNQDEIIFEFRNQTVTSSLDYNSLLDEDLFYKLYIQLTDGYLLSPTVEVKSTIDVLPFCIYHAALIPNTNHLILTGFNREIAKYDYVEKKILNYRLLPIEGNKVKVGDAGNGMEVFVNSSVSASLHILDIDNLETKVSKDFNSGFYDVAPSTKGFIALSFNDEFSGLKMLDRNDINNFLDEEEVSNHYHDRRLAISPVNDNHLIEVSKYILTLYEFSDDGQIISSNNVDILNNGSLKSNISFSADKNMFSAHQKLIFHNSENLIEEEKIDFSSLSHTFDNQNSNIVYFYDFNSFNKVDLSTGSITTLLSEIEPTQILDNGGEVLMLGNSNFMDLIFNQDCGFITIYEKD